MSQQLLVGGRDTPKQLSQNEFVEVIDVDANNNGPGDITRWDVDDDPSLAEQQPKRPAPQPMRTEVVLLEGAVDGP